MAALDISQLRFMIVEDNPFMTQVLKQLLRSFNVRLMREATDGAEAFKLLQTFPPDIILVDWEMQPLSGLDFIKLVRTSDESPDRFVCIIMVAAYSEASNIRAARDDGVTEYLVKPVSAMSLFSGIKTIIEKPRPFVECSTFYGPDRRRREDKNFSGPGRRLYASVAPVRAAYHFRH